MEASEGKARVDLKDGGYVKVSLHNGDLLLEVGTAGEGMAAELLYDDEVEELLDAIDEVRR